MKAKPQREKSAHRHSKSATDLRTTKLSGGIVRRSVTLSAHVDHEAHKIMGEPGFSAFVEEALRRHIQQTKMHRLLDELDEQYGPPSSKAVQEAKATWQRLHELP